jgi:hypothetical protein
VTRAEWKAARRILRSLRRVTPAPMSSPYYHWQEAQRLQGSREHYAALVYPPCPGKRRDAELRNMAAMWENRRYLHAQRRAERLHNERAAAAVAAAEAQGQFVGMSPLQEALKRIEMQWGTSYAEPA